MRLAGVLFPRLAVNDVGTILFAAGMLDVGGDLFVVGPDRIEIGELRCDGGQSAGAAARKTNTLARTKYLTTGVKSNPQVERLAE